MLNLLFNKYSINIYFSYVNSLIWFKMIAFFIILIYLDKKS